MAEKHPYISGSGGLVQTITQLRKAFPNQVTAETLKKLGIAPNNKSFVINILRFVGAIDAEGKKTTNASSIFSKHDDAEFQKGFAGLIETAYAGLFEIHGKDAWTLAADKLISYFRGTDHTSAIVGQRQATTFQALAALAGYAEAPTTKAPSTTRSTTKRETAKVSSAKSKPPSAPSRVSLQNTGVQKRPQLWIDRQNRS